MSDSIMGFWRGDNGPAGKGFNFRGPWDHEAEYAEGDIALVMVDGDGVSVPTLFVMTGAVPVTSETPPQDDTDNWALFVYGPRGAQGEPGEKGDPGDSSVGAVARGEWVSGTTYNPGDIVTSGLDAGTYSVSMLCQMIAAEPIVSTITPLNDAENWTVFYSSVAATPVTAAKVTAGTETKAYLISPSVLKGGIETHGIRASDGVSRIIPMTQAAYDALTTKSATTLYIISG